MAIDLPNLPYPTNALEPHISQMTLEYHYGKHHKHYVDTLNELIHGTSLDKISLEEIMSSSFEENQKIYENAAQAWNHTFFWNCLTASGKDPSSDLTKTIDKSFGSLQDLKQEFASHAKELFGSGWTWLVKDKMGNLKIKSLSNAGNPMAEFSDTPLLVCDVWEHAYYLDYHHERPKFLENFWKVVDWEFVEANLNKELRSSPFKSSQSGRRSFQHQERF